MFIILINSLTIDFWAFIFNNMLILIYLHLLALFLLLLFFLLFITLASLELRVLRLCLPDGGYALQDFVPVLE